MKKQEIRQFYKQKRRELTELERETASLEIYNRVVQYVDFTNKKVSIFLPIERFYEINTWHFLNELKTTHFYLPVVKSADELVHIGYDNPSQIEVSQWGIPEPISGIESDPSLFDVVLVPLLAIDRKGYRVGYGKGFYDQFLSQCSSKCKFIGLSYFDPIDQVFDLHEGDVPLHVCITPSQVHTF